MIDPMRSGLGHAPGIAGGTDTPSLAGKGHQKVVSTLGTAGAGKSMGQDAAFEVAAKFPFDVGRHGIVVPALARQAQVGLEMRLDYPV
jgi:hypothetical protein